MSVVTETYKRVGSLEIRADLEIPRIGASAVVVWIHGGALINGGRDWVPAWLRGACREHGFALVSTDYRLAPETKLAEIVRDIEDLFLWLRHEAPHRLPMDVDRVAAIGESAGGYLALTAGYRASPPPDAVVALYGYGDLIGEWYSRPSTHACHAGVDLTQDELDRITSGAPIADGGDRDGDGHAFYRHCRRHGTWPTAVSGWDPDGEAERFRAFMPVANVDARYPPTLLVHGHDDTDVPYERSSEMADALARHDREHRLLGIPGAEHGFAGADPAAVEAARDEVVAFLARYLRSGVPAVRR
jgi:acetyl esterase/lipase